MRAAPVARGVPGRAGGARYRRRVTGTRSASVLGDLSSATRRFGVWGLVAAVVIIHLVIAAQSVGPMYLVDEVGYVAGANVIAGQGVDWSLCGSTDGFGYSVPLAPLWWLPIQPVVVYQAAAFISAGLGAAVMWPASRLARIFGASRGVALAIAALVTLVPARALLDNYVIADNPLTFLVAWSAVLAWRVADKGRVRDHLLFGLAVGLAAAVHARAIPFVGVAVAWMVIRGITKASAARPAALSAATAAGLAVVGYLGQSAMGSSLFADDTRVDDLVGGVTVGGVGRVLLGQGFTQVVSWSLLTALGVIVCAAHARRAVTASGRSGLAKPWWWLVAAVGAQGAFFVAVLAASSDSAEPVIGRHLDPFVVPIAVLGAAALWARLRPRAVVVAAGAATLALLAYGVLVLPGVDPEARWIPFAVPGLEPFLSPEAGDDRGAIAVAGAIALAGVLGLVLLRRWPRASLSAALTVAIAMTMWTDAVRVDPFESQVRARTTIAAYFANNPEFDAVLAAALLPCVERNKLQFELAGTVAIATDGAYGDNAVVGPVEWPAAESAGRARIPLTIWNGAAVWSAPAAGAP